MKTLMYIIIALLFTMATAQAESVLTYSQLMYEDVGPVASQLPSWMTVDDVEHSVTYDASGITLTTWTCGGIMDIRFPEGTLITKTVYPGVTSSITITRPDGVVITYPENSVISTEAFIVLKQ